MPIRLPSHLHRNRCGIYGFRVVIPKDLRVSFSQREIRLSLRTSSRRAAKRRALRLAFMTNDYFERIRRAPTLDDAIALGQDYIESLGSVSFDDLTESIRELLPHAEGTTNELVTRLIALREQSSAIKTAKLALLKEAFANIPEKGDAEIDSLFCDLYADLAPSIASDCALRNDLQDLTLEAQRTLHCALHSAELDAQQSAHEADRTSLEDFAANVAAKAAVKAAESISGRSPTPTTSVLLSGVVEAYCENQNAESKWTKKTNAENRAIFALWLRDRR